MSINAGIGTSAGPTGMPGISPQLEGPPVDAGGLPAAGLRPGHAPATPPDPRPDAAAPTPPRGGSVLQALRKRGERKPSVNDDADEAGDEASADGPAPSRRAARLLYDISEHLQSQPDVLPGLPDMLLGGCTPQAGVAESEAQETCSWCGDARSQQQIAAWAQPSDGRRALSMLLLTMAIEDHQLRHGDPYGGFRQAAAAARRYAQLGADRAPAWLRPVMERLRDVPSDQISKDLSEQLRRSVTGGSKSLADASERCKPLRPSWLLRRRDMPAGGDADGAGTGRAVDQDAGASYLRMRGVLLA